MANQLCSKKIFKRKSFLERQIARNNLNEFNDVN